VLNVDGTLTGSRQIRLLPRSPNKHTQNSCNRSELLQSAKQLPVIVLNL
jgi:hypothetical protein